MAHYEDSAHSSTEPTYVKAKNQAAQVQKTIDSRKVELKKELENQAHERWQREYAANRLALEETVALLEDQEKQLASEVERMTRAAERVGVSSTELETLRAEIRQEEKLAERVGEELEALQVELRSPPRVQLLQEAVLQRKEIKRQVLGTLGAPLAVLFSVGFLVGWWEHRRRRIHSPDEVAQGLGLRVVGAVPRLPASRSETDWNLEQHCLLESINAIRAMLLRDASIDATRVVMVTSAVAGEGKTTLASHLASSLAQAGRKTLLLDCDLRRPALHELFELDLQPGFSEFLLGEVQLAEAIRPTTIAGLSLVSAGLWDAEVLQQLARPGLAEIFSQLRRDYDFVVIDSHPVLPATDALHLGQHADAVILSVLRGISQGPRVYDAYQRLTSLGIRVWGAVINGARRPDVYGKDYTYVPQRSSLSSIAG
jgi:capsular exopolysaccharide synthesis family protein